MATQIEKERDLAERIVDMIDRLRAGLSALHEDRLDVGSLPVGTFARQVRWSPLWSPGKHPGTAHSRPYTLLSLCKALGDGVYTDAHGVDHTTDLAQVAALILELEELGADTPDVLIRVNAASVEMSRLAPLLKALRAELKTVRAKSKAA